jgi:hypothetical protein
MCPNAEQTLSTEFSDEEPTKPIPNQTTDEIAAEWHAELELPSCERPTRKFRRLSIG